MKSKKLGKKLVINKATVTNIGNEELNKVVGGVTLIGPLCSQVPELCDTFPILQCNSIKNC